MSLPSAKAKEVLDDLGIDSPDILKTHLKEICLERGAFVREGTLNGAEGRLTVKGEKGVILVREDQEYVTRKRFSIAHELGHFELHRKITSAFICTTADMNEWFGKQARIEREVEANEFAAEFLMPKHFVLPKITKQKPSIKLITALSDEFETSFSASAKRYIDLTDEACALVFFDRKNVKYHFQAPNLKAQKYWISPGPLRGNTYAHDVANGETVPQMLSQVDASAWIDTSEMPQWRREKVEEGTIYEHSIFFEKFGFGMTLLWLNDKSLIWA